MCSMGADGSRAPRSCAVSTWRFTAPAAGARRLRSMAWVISGRDAVRNSGRIWGAAVCAAAGRERPTRITHLSAAQLHPPTLRMAFEGPELADIYLPAEIEKRRRSCAAESVMGLPVVHR